MVSEAKKITYDIPFTRNIIKKIRDRVSNGIDFIRTEMVKLMVEIHQKIHDMSIDAMRFNTFLVWLTNEKFQNTLPRQVMLFLNGTLGQSIEQGERKLRSIGVTTWFEKFTSTCVSTMTNSKIQHHFDKNYALQPDSSAKINHVIQTGRELELDKLTTKTDAKNAFLSMKRESMFNALTTYLPALGPH
jgi:hypothetical protein